MSRLRWLLVAITALVTSPAHAAGGKVLISELRTRGPNGANDELVELYNPGAVAVAVGGWQLVRSNSTGATQVIATVAAGTSIPAHRFYLFVNTGSQGWSGSVQGDATYQLGIPDDGGVALLDKNGAQIDAVGFSLGSAWYEGVPLAPLTSSVNQSYERRAGGCDPGVDSDDNASDFFYNGSTPHPQRSTSNCTACAGVTCNQPPDTGCWGSNGSCFAGTCVYPPKATGTGCSDGDACTDGDACDGAGACVSGAPASCATPPPAHCADALVRVSYAAPGTCASASGCQFVSSSETCPFGCDGATGACASDPCSAIDCTTPPNDCYRDDGRCVAGTCVYTLRGADSDCNDGDPCTRGDACDGAGHCVPGSAPPPSVGVCEQYSCDAVSGAHVTARADGSACDDADPCNGHETCQAGACIAGEPVTCNEPPGGSCYESLGTCDPTSGACQYAALAPGAGCGDGGSCAREECDGAGHCMPNVIRCDLPAPTCSDASTSHQASASACSGGACEVTWRDEPCALGCDVASGLCAGDPCIGVTCAGDACHAARCVAGACVHELVPAGTACDDGDPCTGAEACNAAGVCVGVAASCAAAPAAVCVDGDTSRAFVAAGSCASGGCSYTASDDDCPSGCDVATGRCSGDPCAGVVCDEPPTSCHATSGTCVAGLCQYALLAPGTACDDGDACTTADTCDASGACGGQPEPCSPPPASCVDGETARVYDGAGTCVGGACVPAYHDVACSDGCDPATGLCAGDPCAAVACGAASDPCAGPGRCSAGACTYDALPAGTTCDDGDPCTTADACDGAGHCSGSVACGSGGSAGTGGAGTGGVGSAPSTAGTGGSEADAGVAPAAGSAASGDDGGCACRTDAGARGSRASWVGLLALLSLTTRRRRHSR